MNTPAHSSTLVFIGTQGEGAGQGIHVASLDESTGHIGSARLAAEIERPTWLLASPGGQILFAVSEVGNKGDRIGDVCSFSLSRDTGTLTPVDRVPSGGGGPTHLALSPSGDALFIANFGGGQASVVPVGKTGALSPPSAIRTGTGSGPHRRQQGPHAHGVTLDPSGRFLLVPDMGADRVFIYPYDAATHTLDDDDSKAAPRHAVLPAGSGPRLMLFSPDGRFAYLLTELSAEIFAFTWNAGRLTPLASLALDPSGFDAPRSAAAFTMSADGRFLYAGNRASDTLHVFACAADGTLSPVQVVSARGAKPWAIALTPSERFALVANQGSDTVHLFARDPMSGMLTPTDRVLPVPLPTGLACIPVGT